MLKESKGIMEQIRDHLAQGRSSRELIDAGFAPGSVYKAQRQMRRNSHDPKQEPVQATAPSHDIPSDPAEPEWWPKLDDLLEEDEPLALYALLDRDFPRLSERVGELSEKLNQLDHAFARIKNLETANHDLQRRLEPLEESAAVARRKQQLVDNLIDRGLWRRS